MMKFEDEWEGDGQGEKKKCEDDGWWKRWWKNSGEYDWEGENDE